MRRIILVVVSLMGVAMTGEPNARQASRQPEICTEQLANALRLVNSEEYSYKQTNHRFAARDEMLTFLRQKGILGNSPIDLENPRPYELAITTSSDGTHYQIALQRRSDVNDKTTLCRTAAFSDDSRVIFLGQAIDCEAEVVDPTPETQSAFLKGYSPASTIARFSIEGSGAQQSAPGGSSAGRGCAFHKKEFISLFVIASGNSAPLMADVERDIKSNLAHQDARIVGTHIRELNHAESFQFDYAADRSIGIVTVDPIVVVDPTLVGGPHGIAPGETAVKLHIWITETWYKAGQRTCETL
jgi:hypothetical protein